MLSPRDFAALGIDNLAFIKAVAIDGRQAVAIHAADGSELAVFADRESAVTVARNNDFDPVSIH